MKPLIQEIQALQVLDSRGNPTLSVRVETSCGKVGLAYVPSGASTGEHEAVELRDNDPQCYQGKSVHQAVGHVNGALREQIVGKPVLNQEKIDRLMIEADGTKNKSKFGANAILGVSLAVAHAAAATLKQPFYRYVGGVNAHTLPCPMMNIINGGAHANNSLSFQEFMIRPVGAETFSQAVQWGAEIFYRLKTLLQEDGYSTSVGDEGGFAPPLASEEQAIEYILRAIEGAGYRPGEQITLALDCAASEFYDAGEDRYIQNGLKRTSEEQIDFLEELQAKYPIDSIEDPLDENDWAGWKLLTERMGKQTQIVGDDIFVTNPIFLEKGIEQNVANAILIKLNQIGTLTETLEAIHLAQSHGYATVISHRSGETEDTTLADLAVAMGCGQVKTGSLSRTDRVAKYNRLLWIEAELGHVARYGDSRKKPTSFKTTSVVNA